MSKKNTSNEQVREKHNEDIINELFGNSLNETEPDLDIENDVANLGDEPEPETPQRVSAISKPHEEKHKAFFVTAVLILILAVIGLISSINFVSSIVHNLADKTALKNEFSRFLLPVVANDIAPFDKESDIPNSSKVSCSIWNILLNKDTSIYKQSQTGGIEIPEYDVGVSCRELFGTGASLTHQTVRAGELSFAYDEESHNYNCTKDLRYLNYAPKITEMSESNGTYTLTIDYLPPAVTMAAENLGLEVQADKTLEYIINRWDGKNTLIAVKIINKTEID